MLACQMLDARPGESVLDACAAPGGKTAVIAQHLANRGFLAACDREERRIALMRENFGRLNVQMGLIAQCDWTDAAPPPSLRERGQFDRILIDVPCGNTGVMRRRVDLRWRLRPEEFKRMARQQLAIVRAVLPLLRRDGVLVYSTCSLEPEENREVVQRLLVEFPELTLEQEKELFPFRDHFDGAFAARLSKIR
jgi:16S rRNA (cytosine967-C5)-methyltransferase